MSGATAAGTAPATAAVSDGKVDGNVHAPASGSGAAPSVSGVVPVPRKSPSSKDDKKRSPDKVDTDDPKRSESSTATASTAVAGAGVSAGGGSGESRARAGNRRKHRPLYGNNPRPGSGANVDPSNVLETRTRRQPRQTEKVWSVWPKQSRKGPSNPRGSTPSPPPPTHMRTPRRTPAAAA